MWFDFVISSKLHVIKKNMESGNAFLYQRDTYHFVQVTQK